MPPEYLDFELEIGLGQGRDYPVAVLRSPAGEARATMRFPFDEFALERHLDKLQIALLHSGGKRRQALTQEQQDVQDFGQLLFDALMTGDIRSRYEVSQIGAGEKGLRLKLRIADPKLAVLPWEFLYDSRRAEYICLSRHTPIVRYVELPQPPGVLTIEPPLRILGMIASPSDAVTLDVESERQRLEQALAGLIEKGLVELEWLAGQTWRDLQKAMRGGPWHIFHFVGHGAFDADADEGLVLFCDDRGKARRFRATDLGRMLADHRTLRLVFLNACEGARGNERDIFSSTASILVRNRIPAVVAMQYAITDRAAVELSRAFYESLVEGLPVDAAVAEARKAVSWAVNNTVEWGTPVLYMRALDGVLFELAERPDTPSQLRPPAPSPPPTRHPSLVLDLTAQATSVRVNDEVTWTITVTNDGDDDLRTVSVFRGRTLVEDPFDLARAEARQIPFTASYRKEGHRTERIRATAVSSAGDVVHQNAEAAFEVIPQPRSPAPTPPGGPKQRIDASDQVLTITEPLRMEFVRVPAGEFLMGSDPAKDKSAAGNEQPQHTVRLDDYSIGKYPVTNAQYGAFVKATGHVLPKHWSSGAIPPGKEEHPVVNVSWRDAVAFCDWLGTATGKPFRLPSEAEWEKAASWDAGMAEKRIWPWGNVFDAGKCNSKEGKAGGTTPVGQYPNGISPFGALDMSGNVWEWTSSLWGKGIFNPEFGYPYQAADGRENLHSERSRVLRGGSCGNNARYVRCAARSYIADPGYLTWALNSGFRVCVSPGL